VVIGEMPLAMVQSRYRHPDDVSPSKVAKLLCKLFRSTSSMASACDMQSLTYIVGTARVRMAVAIAAFPCLLGVSSYMKLRRSSQS